MRFSILTPHRGKDVQLLSTEVRATQQNPRYSVKNNVAIRMIATFMPKYNEIFNCLLCLYAISSVQQILLIIYCLSQIRYSCIYLKWIKVFLIFYSRALSILLLYFTKKSHDCQFINFQVLKYCIQDWYISFLQFRTR